MTQIPSLPSFSEIADLLSVRKSRFHPSELHGLLCGYISASSGKVELDHRMKNSILGKKNKNPVFEELLQQLYEISYHQMSEFSFEFTLLLPDDDSNINSRTKALGLWCQGFLTGLQQANISIQEREKSDVTETLHDFIEIAKVSYGNIADDEEDETAYFELVEYVRLGVLLIFQEVRPANANIH